MKIATTSLAASALLLAACAAGTGGDTKMIPSGGAAGAMGRDYCHAPPANRNDYFQWNDLCFASR